MEFYRETKFKEIEELGIKVPEDWDIKTFYDVADYINGYPFSTKDWDKTGIPIVRIQNLTGKSKEFNYYSKSLNEKLRRALIDTGDFLFAWSASLGFYIWKGGKALLNQHIYKVIVREKLIDKIFFYYAGQYYLEKYLAIHTVGTTMKHLRKSKLKEIVLPLPPLKEQQTIAEILSTIDKAIEKTQSAIEKTEKLKKGLMQKLLTGEIRIREDWTFYEEKEFKDTEIGRIPKEWDVVRLGDCCIGFQYGLSVKLYDNGDIPIIKMDNIENGYISLKVGTLKYVKNLDSNTLKKYILNYGDILINRTNAPELVGKVGIYLLDKKCVFASYLIRIIPVKLKVYPLFLNYYLLFSHRKLRYLAKRAVSQANIDAKSLKLFEIPLPSLEEQKRIAEVLMTVDKRIELLKKKKEYLQRIKKWFMRKLLTGEIRVRKNERKGT